MKAQNVLLGGALAVAAVTLSALPSDAQVLDAVYRGTMVCSKLPFERGGTVARQAIDVSIKNNQATYTHVVRQKGDQSNETGTGAVEGSKISLKGAWKGSADTYESSYTGSFIRRSASLAGTQTWTHDQKKYTRACSGSIKRPLRAFIPREKKQ